MRNPFLIAASDLAHRDACVRISMSLFTKTRAATRASLLVTAVPRKCICCPGNKFATTLFGVTIRIGIRN